jgi:hypothetical protein
LQSNIDAANTARALTDAALADETTARQNGDNDRYTKSASRRPVRRVGRGRRRAVDVARRGAERRALDTLLELGNQLTADESAVSALTTTSRRARRPTRPSSISPAPRPSPGPRTLRVGSTRPATLVVDTTDARLSDTRTPTDGSVTNAKVASSAAIAYSKLNLAAAVVNADIAAAAAIAYSKLNLATSIVNGDISASAAIVYSKLVLTGSVVNADVSGSAAIAESKLNLASDAAAGTASRRTLGTTSTSAMAGNDKRVLAAQRMAMALWR